MKSNVYSLATNYDTYCAQKHPQNKENQNSNMPLNIFHERSIQKVQSKDIYSSKTYQLVGLKELRSLQLKMRKGTKFLRREFHGKQDRPHSKQSHQYSKIQLKNELLTGREVIETLPKIKQVHPNAQLKKIKRKNLTTEIENPDQSQNGNAQDLKSSLITNDFSLSRLQSTINERKQWWNKICNKITRPNDKFPSIYKSIDTYRHKIQEKQKNSKIQDLINLKSTLWEKTLRSEHQKQKLRLKKETMRTFHDNDQFTARGNSKYKLEGEWLEKKQEEGYQFKRFPSQPSDYQKHNQTIR